MMFVLSANDLFSFILSSFPVFFNGEYSWWTENNFYKRHGKEGEGDRGGCVKGGRGPVFCRSFQSDFTNEMDQDYGSGRAGSHGHPVLGSLKPPPCGFSLLFRPFHKWNYWLYATAENRPPPALDAADLVPFAFLPMALIKIVFRVPDICYTCRSRFAPAAAWGFVPGLPASSSAVWSLASVFAASKIVSISVWFI